MSAAAPSGGLFYEDLHSGLRLQTPGRTITEADVVAFAMLSGDWNRIHVDAEFAASSTFGARLVHGAAVYAITGGLIYAGGWFVSTTVALLGVEGLEFASPVFIGDTISCQLEVLDVRLTRKGKGLLRRRIEVHNQRGDVVQRSISSILIARKEGASDAE